MKNKEIKLNISNLQNNLLEIKQIFKLDKMSFISIINDFVLKIIKQQDKKENLDKFCEVFNNLYNEVLEISNFLNKKINKIFVLLIKNKYYKSICNFNEIMINCGNKKLIDLLEILINSKNEIKFLSNIEIYQIKKTIFFLKQKYNKNNSVVYSLKFDVEQEDINWIEEI